MALSGGSCGSAEVVSGWRTPHGAEVGTGRSYLNVNRDTVSEDTHRWAQAASLDGRSDKNVTVVQFHDGGRGTNHSGLPDWPAYDTQRRATMLLDARCRVVDDPFSDERKLWDEIGGGFPR